MSIRSITIASLSILASLGATAPDSALAQPVLPPPPGPVYQPQSEQPPIEPRVEPDPAYAPPAPSHDPQQQQPAPTYPPQQQPAQTYPPQQPQAYPPQQQPAPAYPPQQPQAYPPQQQPAPTPQPQGYPPPQQPAPTPQPQGYPPPQQPATGYPQPAQGYPPPQQAYPPPQPQGYPPPQPQAYPPPQDQPAPESESIFSNPLSKLQVGFHLGAGSLTASDRTKDSSLTSLGIFARYRFNQRWEAELAVASESGTIESNNAQRSFTPITASALWHVFEVAGVDVHARLGLGRSTETYHNPLYKPIEGPTTHIHLGAGASYIFRGNIGAGAEFRWQSIRRGATDEISALDASGVAYSLVGSYHF